MSERTSCFLSQDLPIQVVLVVVEDVVVVVAAVEDRHQEDVPLEEEVDLDEEAVVLPRRAQEVVVDLVAAVDGLVGEEEAVEGFSYTHTNYIQYPSIYFKKKWIRKCITCFRLFFVRRSSYLK
jgi:hypothetical protein